MNERDTRDRALMRAWLTGALSARDYAWLYLSLWRFGVNWKQN